MAKDDMNFLEFLQGFRRGELITAANSAIEELMEAIQTNGGKGSLTLKFSFEMNKAMQIECDPGIEIKKPKKALGTGIYFVSADNRLTRRDPNQDDMFDELAPRRERADLR